MHYRPPRRADLPVRSQRRTAPSPKGTRRGRNNGKRERKNEIKWNDETQKKLRESDFFFRLLKQESEKTVRDQPEVFDYYLSAFLSSARSITFSLRAEEPDRYLAWFNDWADKNLSSDDKQIWGFLKDQRNASEKTGSTDTKSKIQFIPVHQIRGPEARSFSWFGPPGTPPPEIGVPIHDFDFKGKDKNVIETCERYLNGLRKMVADCIRDP